jgi:hypothetical protein
MYSLVNSMYPLPHCPSFKIDFLGTPHLNNQSQVAEPKMAPNLAASKPELIYDMIHSGELSVSELAEAAGCNKSTIRRISSNIRIFGRFKAPPNKGGRPRNITPVMLDALCEHLLEKPTLYLDEMAVFLWDEFALLATKAGHQSCP